MKTSTKFFSLLLLMMALGAGITADAQSRGRQGGNGKDQQKGQDHNQHNKGQAKHGDHNNKSGYHGDEWTYANAHQHHSHHRVMHVYRRPVIVHAAPALATHRAARYIFYKDYNTYFDTNRQVYFILSGRNWVASRVVPLSMRRINRATAVRVEVNYYGDDFTNYLDKGGRGR